MGSNNSTQRQNENTIINSILLAPATCGMSLFIGTAIVQSNNKKSEIKKNKKKSQKNDLKITK